MNISNSRALYVAIGAFAVVVIVLGYMYYEDQQQTSHIEISVDDDGMTIDGN